MSARHQKQLKTQGYTRLYRIAFIDATLSRLGVLHPEGEALLGGPKEMRSDKTFREQLHMVVSVWRDTVPGTINTTFLDTITPQLPINHGAWFEYSLSRSQPAGLGWVHCVTEEYWSANCWEKVTQLRWPGAGASFWARRVTLPVALPDTWFGDKVPASFDDNLYTVQADAWEVNDEDPTAVFKRLTFDCLKGDTE